MKKYFVVLSALVMVSCSNDSDTDQNFDSENTVPFSLSVLMKEYNGTLGDFYTIDFTQGMKQPSVLFNITDYLSLEDNALFYENGEENLLAFKQGDGRGANAHYLLLDLDDQNVISGFYKDYFPNFQDCFMDAGRIGWNKTKLFTFENDVCDNIGNLRILIHDLTNDQVTELPPLEEAHTGDTPHGILATVDYYFVQYNNHSNDFSNTIMDGLVVYDANTLEEVFSLNTPSEKFILVDGHEIYVAARPDKMEIIHVPTGEVMHSTTNEENFYAIRSKITNVSIHNGKVGYVDSTYAIDIPAYFDFNENESYTVDREKYMAFFNRDIIDFDADVIVPTEFKIDVESMTFAATYLTYGPGENVPKSSSIMFMDFEGNILYDYDFPNSQLAVEKLLKR